LNFDPDPAFHFNSDPDPDPASKKKCGSDPIQIHNTVSYSLANETNFSIS
jgi:hypothetical protein